VFLLLLGGGVVGTPTPLAASDPVVTVVVSGLGKVDVAPSNLRCKSRCTISLAAGTEMTLTATPFSGFVFTAWRGDVCVGAVGDKCVLRADLDTTVTAVFAIASGTTTQATTTTQPPTTTQPTTTQPTTTTATTATTQPTTTTQQHTKPPPIPKSDRPLWDAIQKSVAAQLHIGSVAFNTPTALDRGETAEIEFLLSPKQSIKRLKERISQAGDREGARVQISDYMEADLSGLNFSITRIGSERQLVLPDSTTRWAWEITPTRSGVLHLHLTLTAILTTHGEERELEIRTFEKTLSIRVAWPVKVKDFVHENWQWLWTTILVPLGVWAGQRRRQSKRKDGKAPTDP
jgi:hypothetical protein